MAFGSVSVRKIRPLEERFWDKVEITSTCWIWSGALNSNGRAHMGRGRRGSGTVLASHVSWFLHHGRWPRQALLHTCDDPSCVNPAHLFEGSQGENVQDAAAKRRVRHGIRHHNAKLSPEAVNTIRRLAGTTTQTILAERFGVTQSVISTVISRKAWR